MSDASRVPSGWQTMDAVSRWQQRRAELLADPDLIADEAVILAASPEGEKLDDLLSRLIDAAIWCELRAVEADDLHTALRDRRDRYKARKELIRQTIAELFDVTERRGHRGRLGSASIASAPASVVILDPELVPDMMCKITREPRKTAIRAEIEAGREVPGAVMSNPGAPVLRITPVRKAKNNEGEDAA